MLDIIWRRRRSHEIIGVPRRQANHKIDVIDYIAGICWAAGVIVPTTWVSLNARVGVGVEGRGWRVALAFWANASIPAQTAQASSASFFGGTMLFVFIKVQTAIRL